VAKLGSRLDLLKFGRRTANPRHQTLIATLDWSHDHLSAVERVLLRRVAIFVGTSRWRRRSQWRREGR